MALMAAKDIERALQDLEGWTGDTSGIRKDYLFGDFAAALAFVNRVGDLAERSNHHPDVDIRYNKVTLALATHSEGGVTEKDVALAGQVERLHLAPV